MQKKEYTRWHTLKKNLNERENPPTFKEREIWWCSIGHNVGDEIDGKNKQVNRPVLVVRKFNRYLFWGVPMSRQLKESPYYFKVSMKGEKQSVMLTQLRLWDSRRLNSKLGTLPWGQFKKLKAALGDLLKK